MTLVTLDINPSNGAVTVVSDGTTKYVAPDGLETNPGTIDKPWALTKLRNAGQVAPGATVYLRGGTYTGAFLLAQFGTVAAPITYRPYPGEHVVLDRAKAIRDDGLDGVKLEGSYQLARDLEITNSATQRVLGANLSRPTGLRFGAGVGNRGVNLFIHDTGGNVFDAGAIDCELYGCIIIREGWDGTNDFPGTRGFGHGIYPQNFAGSGRKLFRNCIVGNGYAHCFHNFGGSSKMSEVAVEESTFFMGSACSVHERIAEPVLFAGETGGATGTAVVDGVAVRDCVIYQRFDYPADAGVNGGAIRLGTQQPTGHTPQVHGNIEITGCEIVGVLGVFEQVTALRYRRNRIIGQARPGGTPPFPVNEVWRGNAAARYAAYPPFVDLHDEGGAYVKYNGAPCTLADVQAGTVTSFTAGSNYFSNDPDIKPQNVVAVRPNSEENGRAHVTIVNWQESATVAVDLDGVCEAGKAYELVDVESDVVTPFTYNGSSLSVTMARPAAKDPLGGAIRATRRTGIRFGVFLVREAA